MPTIYQEKAFSFEHVATPPKELQDMLDKKAIDVLLKIIEYKLTHSTDNVEDHVYFLEGRTGSGKSTAFPSELFFAFNKNIRVVVPRVNLAQSVPDDMCKFERRLKMGVNIGFSTGPMKNIPVENPSIRFMTTEIFRQSLLKKAINAPIVLIDEVHMLDNPAVNNLQAIKNYLYDSSIPNNRKPLFIFQSATINIKMLSDYFLVKDFEEVRKDWRLIGHIEGTRNFPVEQRNLKINEESKMNPETVANYLVDKTIPECVKSPSKLPNNIPVKDVLVFVYGKKPIEELIEHLDKKLSKQKLPFKVLDYVTNPMEKEVNEWRNANKNKTRILVVPYISGIYSYGHVLLKYNIDPDLEARQNEIKIYLSTEVLEAGKTIDTLYQVFDTGVVNRVFNKPLLYSPFGRQGGTKAPVNKAAVMQRLGRVGRKAPGISTTLYSIETHKKLPQEPDPDNINVVSRADKITQPSGFIDLLADNDYICPNSVDTNIRTGQDLIDACLMTPFGVLVSDVHNRDFDLNTWKLKAKELFYLEGEDLQSALLKSRYSRGNLGNLINTNDNNVEFPIDKFKNMKTNPLRNEVVASISDARTEFVSFLTSPEKTIYS